MYRLNLMIHTHGMLLYLLIADCWTCGCVPVMGWYVISYRRVPLADSALWLCYSMVIGLIALVAAYLIWQCMFQPLWLDGLLLLDNSCSVSQYS